MDDLLPALQQAKIVPLIQSNEPDEAVAIAEALLKADLNVLEVVLRTEAAFECLKAVIRAFPDACVGAGTVLSSMQADCAIDCDAKFLVSPGLHSDVIDAASRWQVAVLPGISTASELQHAYNMNLRLVKFFPASLVGGPPMLKALSAVFRDMRFVPTGGISADNLMDYLDVPSVVACGGSWLTPSAAVAKKDFAAITKLAEQARRKADKKAD